MFVPFLSIYTQQIKTGIRSAFLLFHDSSGIPYIKLVFLVLAADKETPTLLFMFLPGFVIG